MDDCTPICFSYKPALLKLFSTPFKRPFRPFTKKKTEGGDVPSTTWNLPRNNFEFVTLNYTSQLQVCGQEFLGPQTCSFDGWVTVTDGMGNPKQGKNRNENSKSLVFQIAESKPTKKVNDPKILNCNNCKVFQGKVPWFFIWKHMVIGRRLPFWVSLHFRRYGAIVYLIAQSMSFFAGVFGSDFEIQKHVEQREPSPDDISWNLDWSIRILILAYEIISKYIWVVFHPLYQTANQGEFWTLLMLSEWLEGGNKNPRLSQQKGKVHRTFQVPFYGGILTVT